MLELYLISYSIYLRWYLEDSFVSFSWGLLSFESSITHFTWWEFVLKWLWWHLVLPISDTTSEWGGDNRPHTQIHSTCSCNIFPHCSVFIANILIRVSGAAASHVFTAGLWHHHISEAPHKHSPRLRSGLGKLMATPSPVSSLSIEWHLSKTPWMMKAAGKNVTSRRLWKFFLGVCFN